MTVNHALPLLTVRPDLPPMFSFPGSTPPPSCHTLPVTSCPAQGRLAFNARGLQKALEDRGSAEEKQSGSEREAMRASDAAVGGCRT